MGSPYIYYMYAGMKFVDFNLVVAKIDRQTAKFSGYTVCISYCVDLSANNLSVAREKPMQWLFLYEGWAYLPLNV